MAAKQLGKKGVFLTFISIAIIAAIILVSTPTTTNLKDDLKVVEIRISKVDEYVIDLEKVYLENTLKAVGRRTIIALIEYMNSENLFLSNFEDAFSEVLLNGTIDGTNIDDFIDPDIMTGKTYKDYLYANDAISVKKAAENAFNVQTDFEELIVENIRVSQISPWFLDIEADILYNVSTTEGTASWTRNVTIKTSIDIEKFDDPLYLVKTSGSIRNKIRRSGTKFNEWDRDKVKDFITDGNYTHFENSEAPNFMSKFTDDSTGSSCCGIESFVDPNNAAISDRTVNYADHSYWGSVISCPSSSLYTVNGITNGGFPNFKVDFDHLVLYNLLEHGSLNCPP